VVISASTVVVLMVVQLCSQAVVVGCIPFNGSWESDLMVIETVQIIFLQGRRC